MTYGWEKGVTPATIKAMEQLLPDGLVLAGVAVAHVENVEAALISANDLGGFSDIARADLCKDINGDAESNYVDAVLRMRE